MASWGGGGLLLSPIICNDLCYALFSFVLTACATFPTGDNFDSNTGTSHDCQSSTVVYSVLNILRASVPVCGGPAKYRSGSGAESIFQKLINKIDSQ